jgi:predicted small secreted protein
MGKGLPAYCSKPERDRKEIKMRTKIAAVVLLLVCIWTLSGCHTVHGIGQDIESGGQAIKKSSGK